MEKILSQKRALIIYLPVLHRGYINILRELQKKISRVYILDNSLVKKLYKYEPSISAIETRDTKKILRGLGYDKVIVLPEAGLKTFSDVRFYMIDDDISWNLYSKFLKKSDVIWLSAFLRWDRSKVLSELNVDAIETSSPENVRFMKLAYKEGEKSSDWWRQVGAVLVKSGKIILKGYNKGMPDDHTPYQVGALRDYMEVGEKPEISSTIHGEQMIIVGAAKKGISVRSTSLYVTHFPCVVCAKLIALSGIKKVFFGEGSSNADGEKVLKSAGVTITRVKIQQIR